MTAGSRYDRETTNGEDRYYHLVLLAENNQGYQNLMKIVSKGFVDGFYYKPRVDYEVLETYHEGIIALSACLAGEVQRYIERGIRRWKREEVAMKAAGQPTDEARAKVRAWQARQRDFIKQTGLKRDSSREQIG